MSVKAVLDNPETQSDALDHLLFFDAPRGPWRVQRPDGAFFLRWVTDEREWTTDADKAVAFSTEGSAQHLIDIQFGSMAGRKAFRGARPVMVGVEPGDHVPCACGLMHERDADADTVGHGALL